MNTHAHYNTSTDIWGLAVFYYTSSAHLVKEEMDSFPQKKKKHDLQRK